MTTRGNQFKTVALIGLGLLAVVGGLVLVAGDQLKRAVMQQLTTDMFVASDRDSFDPGLSVGVRFPMLSARLNEMPVTDISRLAGDKGMIFIAVRSVDW
jgi:hypothetical protein